jgi:putative phosphoesterase
MRIAFISDIHGNSEALKAVLRDIDSKQVDKIVVLGDICFRGLHPKESLELIRTLETDVIKGNADEWVLRGIRKEEVQHGAFEIMTSEREWTMSQLDQEDLDYFASLPTNLHMEIEGVKIHAFHATPNDLFEIIQPEQTELIREKLISTEGDVFIYAHIHKAFFRAIDGKLVLNLGSVGLPFDGVPKASYALVDIQNSSVTSSIVKVSYDLEKVIEEIRASDYPNKEFLVRVLTETSV